MRAKSTRDRKWLKRKHKDDEKTQHDDPPNLEVRLGLWQNQIVYWTNEENLKTETWSLNPKIPTGNEHLKVEVTIGFLIGNELYCKKRVKHTVLLSNNFSSWNEANPDNPPPPLSCSQTQQAPLCLFPCFLPFRSVRQVPFTAERHCSDQSSN